LLDEEGSDLIDCCRSARYQARMNPVQRLQVQLLLALLGNHFQVRPHRSLGYSFGIGIVILLTLHEGLRVLGWDDAGLEPQIP